MEWKVFTTLLILIILAVISAFIVHKQGVTQLKVMETYDNYINEDLFRSYDGFYSDDPKASICYDRFKNAQEDTTINANKRFSTVKKEIAKSKFKKILSDLVKEHGIRARNNDIMSRFSCVDEDAEDCLDNLPRPVSLITYNYCKKFLLEKLNEKMLIYDQTTDYDHIPFDLQKDVLTTFKQLQNTDKNIQYFKFIIILNRENKNKVFTVNCEMLYDNNFSEYTIVSLELTGLTTNENSTTGFLNYNINSEYNCDNNGVSCSLSTRPECKQPSDAKVEQQRKDEKKEETKLRDSKCFYKNAENKVDCISIDESGCSGVWDTRCKKDTDCPFFGSKGNTNYTNSRGGCKEDGHCELPLNMINLGYRKYSHKWADRPMCHNCPEIKHCIGKECNQCCHLQGDNPDYAFEFDKPFRLRQKDELDEKGLKYFDIKF